jgi:hypothetical protein
MKLLRSSAWLDDSGMLVLEFVKSNGNGTTEKTRVWMTPQEACHFTDKMLSACTIKRPQAKL